MFLAGRLTELLGGSGPCNLLQLPCCFLNADENTLLYEDAFATVVTTDQQFENVLRIHDKDDEDDNVAFVLDSSLRLSRSDMEGTVRFAFTTPGGLRRGIEIDSTKIMSKEIDTFEQLLCQSIYESEHREVPTEAVMDQVMGYCRRTSSTTKPAATQEDGDTSENKPEHLEGITMMEFDSEDTKTFVPAARNCVLAFATDGDSCKHVLKVLGSDGGVFYEEQVAELFNFEIIQHNQSVVWLSRRSRPVRVYSLRFSDKELYEEFCTDIAEKTFESKRQAKADKLKADIDWLSGAFRHDVTMEDRDDMNEEDLVEFADEGYNGGNNESYDDGSGSDSEGGSDDGRRGPYHRLSGGGGPAPADRNLSLALGLRHQRAFVSKGSAIHVSSVDQDGTRDELDLPILDPKEKTAFTPSKVMLHGDERSLLLLDPNKNDSVFRMDLERGQVVEEWKSTLHGEAIPTREVQHTSKLAQRTGEQTFFGVNKKSFFRMDPRVNAENKLVGGDEMKTYTKEKFNCAATTGAGHMVVGSETGELKLFNTTRKINMNAKTSLPGLGDPLTGVDVSDDGNWILGTTRTYLLVIPTMLENGKTGFEARMGQNKPVPRKLQINYNDLIKLGLTKVNFTPARFNVDEQSSEQRIVTSTGPFLITWNFRKVKQNILNQYKIQRLRETVVEGQFMFGDPRAIVVATHNTVDVKKLKPKK